MYEEYENDFEEEVHLDTDDFDDEDDNDDEITLVLPEPHTGQQKVIDSKSRFKVLCCGRRWGKTLVCIIISIRAMLEGKAVAYVAPEFGFGKELFAEVLRLLPSNLFKTNNKSELFIELITGGTLRFLSGEALDSFRGRKFHLVIIDEAAKIPGLEEAWNMAIRPTLTDYRGHALFISTPKGKNFFYTLFLKGKNRENGYESFHYPTSANPYIDKDEIEQARDEMPEAAFNQEFLAIPGENSGNPFKQQYIDKYTIKRLSDKPAVAYGIDLAKSVDYSVITGLDKDGNMCHFDRWQTTHEMNKEKIKALPNNIVKVVDATGIGSVIYEELQYEVYNLHPFIFTSASKPKLLKKLINDFEKGLLYVNQFTADEMSVFEQKETANGYIKYEAQSGFHDDAIIALALANHGKESYISVQNWKLYQF